MAITQISQITVRKGLQDDLPQLAGGEFGWAIDTSNLYIGNGTLAEGAAAVGVTQILTAGSALIQDLVNYQYRGAGNIPVRYTEARTVPDKLQETVSVKDFFAVGDGVTDDSAAFQTALQYLYSYGTDPGMTNSVADPRLRKILFVPAGRYLINTAGNISIPSYCTLAGEGAESSILVLGNASNSVSMVTVSSVLRDNNEIAQNIVLRDLALQAGNVSAVKIANATNVAISRVSFVGTNNSTPTAGVELVGTADVGNVAITDCRFSSLGNGIYAAPPAGNVYSYVSVRDSVFNDLGNGVQIANALGSATGISVTRNIFQRIAISAQYYGNSSNNIISGENIHIRVGNDPISGLPINPVINVYGTNFSSWGDIFDRDDVAASNPTAARIRLYSGSSVAMDGTLAIALRNRRIGSASVISTIDTISMGAQTLCQFVDNGISNSSITIDYTLSFGNYRRQGKINWTTSRDPAIADLSGYTEEYSDNSDFAGLPLDFSLMTQANPYRIEYNSNVAGANLIYSVDSFNSQN